MGVKEWAQVLGYNAVDACLAHDYDRELIVPLAVLAALGITNTRDSFTIGARTWLELVIARKVDV